MTLAPPLHGPGWLEGAGPGIEQLCRVEDIVLCAEATPAPRGARPDGVSTTSFLYVGLTDAVAFVDVHTSSGDTYTCHLSDMAGASLGDYDPASGLVTYTTLDAHGDTVWTSGPDGMPSAYAVYDPFGNMTSGSITTPIRWQGSWQDVYSGLYYVVARWYDPLSGRFLSEDPVEQDAARPQDRDPYPYGSGDPLGSVDPNGNTALPIRYSLDTTLVGGYYEPGKVPGSAANWFICAAGAARVVLAFVGNNPLWRTGVYGSTYHSWPTTAYYDSWGGKHPVGGVDWNGQDYMMYLAYAVRPPQFPRKGLFNGLNGATVEQVQQVLNWEYAGHGTNGVYVRTAPFIVARSSTSYSTFVAQIETQLVTKGVPVQLAVMTGVPAGYSSGLPSWKLTRSFGQGDYVCASTARNGLCTKWTHNGKKVTVSDQCTAFNRDRTCRHWTGYKDIGHAIAVVGYNADSFFYIDTCQARSGCNQHNPQPFDQVPRGAWPISKKLLYATMHRLGALGFNSGYLLYIGAPSDRTTGW